MKVLNNFSLMKLTFSSHIWFLRTAEALVSTSLDALGYKYVNIDKPFKLIMHSEKAFSCYSHLNFERPKQMIAEQKVSETGG